MEQDESKNVVVIATKKLKSQRAIAEACGVSVQAVSKWKSKYVSARYVNRFAEVTGIPRWMIRPDLYPYEKEKA